MLCLLINIECLIKYINTKIILTVTRVTQRVWNLLKKYIYIIINNNNNDNNNNINRWFGPFIALSMFGELWFLKILSYCFYK